MQVQARMANAANDAPKRPNVHIAAADTDVKTGESGRADTPVAESGAGMVPDGASVVRTKARRGQSGGNKEARPGPLETLTRRRRAKAAVKRRKTSKTRIEKLFLGERRWVERHRRKEDQHAAALRLGISRWQYQRSERFCKDDPQSMRLAGHEWCRIMRARAGKKQREVADDLKVHRVWVHRMESGLEDCDTLIWYWEQ